MIGFFSKYFFANGFFGLKFLSKSLVQGLPAGITLDFTTQITTIHPNNTPPASLLAFWQECSAPRGVTRFWGADK